MRRWEASLAGSLDATLPAARPLRPDHSINPVLCCACWVSKVAQHQPKHTIHQPETTTGTDLPAAAAVAAAPILFTFQGRRVSINATRSALH
jgi:hypothetical protein